MGDGTSGITCRGDGRARTEELEGEREGSKGMGRRVEAQESSLVEALRAAVAGFAGCEPEKVELRVEAPGLDAGAGRSIRVEIRSLEAVVEDDDRAVAADAPSPERQATQEETRVETRVDEAASVEGPVEGEEDDGSTGRVTIDELDEEATAAADFLEELLDILELPGDLQIRVLEDRAEVEIVNVGSGVLIGRRGQTLDALQELVRGAMQRLYERRSRVKIDIEGYRERRLEKYLDKAQRAVQDVLELGEAERLEPMDSFDRKAVHHLVAEYDGVRSHSQGLEPNRRVIIERDE